MSTWKFRVEIFDNIEIVLREKTPTLFFSNGRKLHVFDNNKKQKPFLFHDLFLLTSGQLFITIIKSRRVYGKLL